MLASFNKKNCPGSHLVGANVLFSPTMMCYRRRKLQPETPSTRGLVKGISQTVRKGRVRILTSERTTKSEASKSKNKKSLNKRKLEVTKGDKPSPFPKYI